MPISDVDVGKFGVLWCEIIISILVIVLLIFPLLDSEASEIVQNIAIVPKVFYLLPCVGVIVFSFFACWKTYPRNIVE